MEIIYIMVLSQDNSIFKHKTFVDLLDDKQFGFTDKKKNELKAKYLAVIGSLDTAREELKNVKLSESDLKKIRDYKFPNMSESEIKQLRDKINKEGEKLKKQLASNPNVDVNVNAKRNSIMNQSQQQLIQTGGDFYGVMSYLKRLLVNFLVTYIFYSLTGAAVAPLTGAFNSLIEIIESFAPEFEDFFFVPLFAIRGTQTILFSEEVSSGVTFVLNSLRRLIRLSLLPAGILTFGVGTASLVEYIQNMLGTTGQRRTFLNTLNNNIVNTISTLTNYFTTPDRVDADVEEAQSIISGLGGIVRDYARRGVNIVKSIASGVWSISSFIREPVGNSLDFVITLVNNYFDSINESYHRGDITLDVLTGGAMLITVCGFTFLYGSNPSLSMTTLIIGFMNFDLRDTSGILTPIVMSLRNNLNRERQLAVDAGVRQALENGAAGDGTDPIPVGIVEASTNFYNEMINDPLVRGATDAARRVGNVLRPAGAAAAEAARHLAVRTASDESTSNLEHEGSSHPLGPVTISTSGISPHRRQPVEDLVRSDSVQSDTRSTMGTETQGSFPAHGEGSSRRAPARAPAIAHTISTRGTGTQGSFSTHGEGSYTGAPAIAQRGRVRGRGTGRNRGRGTGRNRGRGTGRNRGQVRGREDNSSSSSQSSSSQRPLTRLKTSEQPPLPSGTPPSSAPPSPSGTPPSSAPPSTSGTLPPEPQDADMTEVGTQQPEPEPQDADMTEVGTQPRRSGRTRGTGGARKTRKGRKARKARKTRKSTKARKAHKARKVNNKARKTRKSTKARKARKTRRSRK